MMLRTGILILVLATAGARAPDAVQAAEPGGTKTDIIAKRMVNRTIDGESVVFLYENVRIDRDSMVVESDSAVFYPDVEEYDFYSRVRMTRGASVLTCGTAFYNDRTNDADFADGVRIVEGDQIATSDRAELRRAGDLLLLIRNARVVTPGYVVHADTIARYEDIDEGEAWGHVILVEPDASSVVTGGHATFDRGGGSMTVDRGPKMESREQGDDPLLATALRMHFLRDLDRIVMVDSVSIRQGTTLALADTAQVFGRERMLLTGGPPTADDGTGGTFRAEAMEYWYADGEVRSMVLMGSAVVEDSDPADLASRFRGLPDSNTLSGDTITLDMEDGHPVRSLVVGNARSVFVPVDAAKEIAYNDVSGDTIVLSFEDRRVHQVDVRGGMKGSYSFMRLENLEQMATDAIAALDSLLTMQGDSLALLLPDSLAAALPLVRGGWESLDPALAMAMAAVLADSLVAGRDSTLAYAARRILAVSSVDTTASGDDIVDFSSLREFVDYDGHMGLFLLGERQIAIRGNGHMKYGTMDLTGGDIRLDTDKRELYATDDPMLVDGSQKIAGEDMAYDFGNRTGAVNNGATAMDDYYYVGDRIKRFGDGDLKIRGGKMTSCDLARPHYHFWSDQMKIQLGDKVVAKPIVMKIGEVPIFALPFYFKSLKTGRRSGILFPTFDFGWGSRTGRYIRNWGYYWATSDYTDVTFRGDYNERRELTWQISNQYRKRYAFDGRIHYSRRSTFGDAARTKQWQLRWNHSQPELFDYYRFSAELSMSSSEIEREDLLNDVAQQVINGQQKSNVSVSRSWQNVSGSLAFTRDEYVNAADSVLTSNNRLNVQNFPTLSLSFKSRALKAPLRGGGKGNFFGNMLRNTYVRHSYNAASNRTNFETTTRTNDKASGTLSLDIKPPRVVIFNVSSGVSSGFSWNRDETTGEIYQIIEGDTVVVDATELVEESAKSVSVNSSVSTTLYGLFTPHIGSLRGIRHTVRFSTSHSWRPEISGTQIADQRFNLSMGHSFDLKFLDNSARAGRDSTEQYRKLDGVVDWNLSTSYDPDNDHDSRWSTITSTLKLKPGTSRNAQVTVNNVFDPYEMRTTSTRLTYGLSLGGKIDTGGKIVEVQEELNESIGLLAGLDSLNTAPVETDDDPADLDNEALWAENDTINEQNDIGFSRFGEQNQEEGRDDTEGGLFIPWRAGSSFSYSKNHLSESVTARLGLNASATLTRTWKFSWRGNYDLEQGIMTTQSWNLEKDLHCWSMRFSRNITASDQQFGFVISLKAIPDIKVTKGKDDLVGGLSGLGGGSFLTR